jgi:hypothetical protein
VIHLGSLIVHDDALHTASEHISKHRRKNRQLNLTSHGRARLLSQIKNPS